MPITHALFESSSGYALFDVKLAEDIASHTQAAQDSIKDLSKFGKMVELRSFVPFKSAAHALENINNISEGLVHEHLQSLIELNLSKSSSSSKKASVILAVSESTLAGNIREATGVQCDASEKAQDIIRGIRLHAAKLLPSLAEDDLTKAQLGLGHSYSRSKVKFNVNRMDNMIIQAIALLDQLDKDVNLFSMRVREWYGYHYPELVKLVPDNYTYARLIVFIGDKDTLNEDKLSGLEELLEEVQSAAKSTGETLSTIESPSTTASNILSAARNSMGSSLSPVDMLNISAFAQRVVSLSQYRRSLVTYLATKMNDVAPSLTALLGLISHAGSLTNLSKYPASTVQILGAEKALFRALKTKGNTPKYGLLYHSTFIGRAQPKHKGRISRFLANKCSIASRIDCYSENPTKKFGEALRAQVEERLNFFETGAPPSKNADAMRKVLEDLSLEDADSDVEMDGAGPALTTLEPSPKKKSKKDKESKKKRKSDAMDDEDAEDEPPVKKVKLSKERRRPEAVDEGEGREHKKKKKDKKDKKEKKEKKKSKD
ncbi:Nop-domain-containing protein [Gymnopus androsaceus JB14]|uniref:Nucleolar protein 56 n=1 Tax=Gymnopus androsaceus JB14 TaxID=1447944 RepID=A0A6A4HQ00_9AGAR|nr:Nop-domain-containing protein [Gymnopus androsaceus JB14]